MVAVDSNRLSNVIGYDLRPGEFNQVTPNLPQRIVILGQPNTANENGITENEIKEYSLLKSVGDRYGYGSPIYNMMRILRPQSGTGVGSVKTIVIPQKASDSATTKILNVEPTGSATANATHTLVINGRRRIGAARYDFTIVKGETAAQIAQKMVDTVNDALAAPVTGKVDTNVTASESLLAETKFAGKIADELNIEVDTNDQPAGVSYSVTEDQSGAGVPAIQSALNKFVEWNTIILNPYGTDVHTTLEDVNGRPSEYGGTGLYSPTVFRPFVALFGNRDGDTTIDFSTQKEEVTNVVCPAPNSPNFNHEVAAAYGRLLATTAQNTPHLDIQGRKVPDITVGETAGKFSDYNFRDAAVKRGWSTAEIEAGAYVIRDFVTTYHPDGETPLQFNHVRNLIIDWNIRFRYSLLEESFVVGKAIASNGTFVQASDVIKPKQWKAQLAEFAEDLSADGLISEPSFFKANTEVTIDDVNPDRLNTSIKYKRTGFARILSTTASAGFALG